MLLLHQTFSHFEAADPRHTESLLLTFIWALQRASSLWIRQYTGTVFNYHCFEQVKLDSAASPVLYPVVNPHACTHCNILTFSSWRFVRWTYGMQLWRHVSSPFYTRSMQTYICNQNLELHIQVFQSSICTWKWFPHMGIILKMCTMHMFGASVSELYLLIKLLINIERTVDLHVITK